MPSTARLHGGGFAATVLAGGSSAPMRPSTLRVPNQAAVAIRATAKAPQAMGAMWRGGLGGGASASCGADAAIRWPCSNVTLRLLV